MPFGIRLGGGQGYGMRRSGGGGGCGGRAAIAIVIAVIGIVTYYMNTEKNPVTGEEQRVALSVPDEMKLGLEAAPQMASEMGGAIDPRSDPRAAMVAEVGRRIVERSDARKSPYVGNYNFYLLADPQTVNAFALPGGQVFITEALYDRLENEAQLAGVLGHEIGHVVHRHAAEHMAKGQLGQMLVGAVAVGASGGEDRGRTATIAAVMANQMLQLRYGRKDELESDDYGLKWMAQAGYDPSEMLRVMQILKEASDGGGRGPSFLQTHPDPDARIEKIQSYLRENYPNGVPRDLTKGRPLR
jgi:predicted Zn-dependent protease